MNNRTLPWRDFLTDDERDILAKADAAKAEWLRLNASRAGIVNRAIHRASSHRAKQAIREQSIRENA
jgi:hypothetical protein